MTTLSEMLEEEHYLAIQLKNVKTREMELRLKIVEKLTGADAEPGTHNYSKYGYKIKVKLGLNYNLDQEALQVLIDDDLLSDEELELIRTKYELKIGEYKKADDTETLDDVIIVKPAAPTLEIELGELNEL